MKMDYRQESQNGHSALQVDETKTEEKGQWIGSPLLPRLLPAR
jgi:hypothetical protein